ncbi:MAG: DUF1573 domain-containing protein [Bacteroidetes bacterium]|nr:DUF1573 domain-containing protein [Bacteroidota bacterium]
MKKSILAIALFISVSGAFAQDSGKQGAATPAPVDNPNAPDFKFKIETYDFGTIKQGDQITHDFTFVNTGKEPLIITDAKGSCGCTVPTWPKEPIGKGQSAVIHVVFNSAGKNGAQDKTVSLTSNAKSGVKVLHLKGTVEAPAQPAAQPGQQSVPPAPEKH